MISDQLHQQLIAYLGQHIGRVRPCSVCGQDESFLLLQELVNLPFQSNTMSMALGGEYATHLVLVCGKCGNTHLLNANILGAMPLLSAAELIPANPDTPPGAMGHGD